MELKNYIEFVRNNPTCYLATVEDDQPRVRAFACWMADETGFYFDTANYKDNFNQLQKNPKAEACFYSSEEKRMLRVSGKVEFDDDPSLRKKLFKDKEDNPDTVIFKITSGEIIDWFKKDGKSQKEKLSF